jgi:hypothetical protein
VHSHIPLSADRVTMARPAHEAGIWDVACADVHPSDYVSLDEHGRLYWSGLLSYEHYGDYFLGKPSEA